MRWSEASSTRRPARSSDREAGSWVLRARCWVLLVSTALLSVAAGAASPAEEKHISVYSPVAIYSLPILDRGGREYVGLLELLEPLGRVSSQSDGRHWRLRYNALDADLTAGKTHGKIHGHDFDFGAPFLIENSRGLVPLTSLSALLPRFLGAPVNFREGARRLFIGDVGIQTSFRLDASNPPRLVLSFNAPVNPTISTEPGKLRMIFKRDPIVSPGSPSISFDNKVITRASYSESNGDAELDVTAVEPLLATFSPDRRTITISPIASEAQTGTPANSTPQQNPTQAPTAANQAPSAVSSNPSDHRALAVIDPAHGGDERGAALSETLAEKDVTLGFARLLRHELEIRGFAATLLRDADTTLTLDQRATAANVAHAGIYITLHATSQGSGARVYTSLLPVEAPSKGIFHAWNAAQAPALPLSRTVSAAIVTELQKKEFATQASSASLRPLNNVFMPAIAVELAPGANGLADLTSANYQQRAAAAIADAIASVRDRLGVQP
jgi:N-acetylmuramoyl-L-alanine amidase